MLCGLIACSSFAQTSATATITKEDLEKMVKELSAYLPENPKYKYPIKCFVVDDKEPNAFATIDDPKLPQPQSEMHVNTGILKLVNGDLKLVRAVVAHEISHLSKGHVMDKERTKAHDYFTLFTREQESEADATGAMILQRAGYSKDDMIKMLLTLADNATSIPKSFDMINDHPDCRTRAANLMDNPAIQRSLVEYDAGQALLEVRLFGRAADFFDLAAKKEPKLIEAYLLSAQARLMDYFQFIPGDISDTWFRPDFGPTLRKPALAGTRGSTSEILAKYALAVSKLADAEKVAGGTAKFNELKGLLLVLEPRGDAATLKSGIDILQKLSDAAMTVGEKLRNANNAAIGYQRLGQITEGVAYLTKAQTFGNVAGYFNPYAVENILLHGAPKFEDATAAKFAGHIHTWLASSDATNPHYAEMKKEYASFCTKYSLKAEEVKESQVAFCRTFALNVSGKQLTLLEKEDSLLADLGAPDTTLIYNPKYPNFKELRFSGGNFIATLSGERVLRMTSYIVGSSVEIRPTDITNSASITLRVGDDASQLGFDLDSLPVVKLVRGNTVEDWKYIPSISLALQVNGKIISAISVVPDLPL